jgi:hypothetical protein
MAHSAAKAVHLQSVQALLGHSCPGFCRRSLSSPSLGFPPVLRSVSALLTPGFPVQQRNPNQSSPPLQAGNTSFIRQLSSSSSAFSPWRTGLAPAGGRSAKAKSGVGMMATDGKKREIMVQHILVKEEDEKLLTELQQRILSKI